MADPSAVMPDVYASPRLRAYFDPWPKNDDPTSLIEKLRGLYPIRSDRYELTIVEPKLTAREGEVALALTLQLVEYDPEHKKIMNVFQQDITIATLPAELADGRFVVGGVPLALSPDAIPMRIDRMLTPLAQRAEALLAAWSSPQPPTPADLFL
jgi:hypothetical protein